MTSDTAGEPDGERLREPPSERFAGESHHFSLADALADLRAEEGPARNGHRQITLFHRGPTAQVLFTFEPGGHLDEHSAHGMVTIHAIEGHLAVHANGRDHSLLAGELLILDPDVLHDVRATATSAMLLTVHMKE